MHFRKDAITIGYIERIEAAEENGLSPVTVRVSANNQNWVISANLPAAGLSVGKGVVVTYDPYDLSCSDITWDASDSNRPSRQRSMPWRILALSAELCFEILSNSKVLFIATLLLALFVFRFFSDSNELRDRFFFCMFFACFAFALLTNSAIQRAGMKRSPSAAKLQSIKLFFAVGIVAIIAAVFSFFVGLSGSPNSPTVKATLPTPMTENERLRTDPRVLEGIKALKELEERRATSYPATTRSSDSLRTRNTLINAETRR